MRCAHPPAPAHSSPLCRRPRPSPWPSSQENDRRRTLAAISIPMRSLIRPLLPPGFEFAVIDHTGKVLFHSDQHRNTNENFFQETDHNRRLRAQVAAHKSEPVNIRYWGAVYRAYLKPMALPDAYVVAMAEKHRGWTINREWLVVALIFLAGYLVLWLGIAAVTLLRDASWIWRIRLAASATTASRAVSGPSWHGRGRGAALRQKQSPFLGGSPSSCRLDRCAHHSETASSNSPRAVEGAGR